MHDEPHTNNEHELGEVSSLSVLAARLIEPGCERGVNNVLGRCAPA